MSQLKRLFLILPQQRLVRVIRLSINHNEPNHIGFIGCAICQEAGLFRCIGNPTTMKRSFDITFPGVKKANRIAAGKKRKS